MNVILFQKNGDRNICEVAKSGTLLAAVFDWRFPKEIKVIKIVLAHLDLIRQREKKIKK